MKKIFYLSILIFIGCKDRTNSEINIHQNDNVEMQISLLMHSIHLMKIL